MIIDPVLSYPSPSAIGETARRMLLLGQDSESSQREDAKILTTVPSRRLPDNVFSIEMRQHKLYQEAILQQMIGYGRREREALLKPAVSPQECVVQSE